MIRVKCDNRVAVYLSANKSSLSTLMTIQNIAVRIALDDFYTTPSLSLYVISSATTSILTTETCNVEISEENISLTGPISVNKPYSNLIVVNKAAVEITITDLELIDVTALKKKSQPNGLIDSNVYMYLVTPFFI